MDQHEIPTLTTTEATVSVKHISYHGWTECFHLSNSLVEAVVVPAIGRIMHFGLIGESESAFWQNREMDGLLPRADATKWANYGGDKCWPAPQSAWLQQTGRNWPPPPAFDAGPVQATVEGHAVVLASPIDPSFGVQMLRTVMLDPIHPRMSILTEFRKLQGPPVKLAIWTITQLADPEAILVPVSASFPRGYQPLLEAEPAALERQGRLLSFRRNSINFNKIGSDSSCVAWLGKNLALRIDAESGPGVYPDGGCLIEVYTNPDPQKYVELETLGPLQILRPGDQIRRTTSYTVMPRALFSAAQMDSFKTPDSHPTANH